MHSVNNLTELPEVFKIYQKQFTLAYTEQFSIAVYSCIIQAYLLTLIICYSLILLLWSCE